MRKNLIFRLVSFFMTFFIISTFITSISYAENIIEEDGSEQTRLEWLNYLENLEANVNDNEIEVEYSSQVINLDDDNIYMEPEVKIVDSTENNNLRYTVLVLDTSGSMAGKPINYLKLSAKKFCKSVLEANGDNYVAIVTYSSNAKKVCEFTSDINVLNKYVDSFYTSGSTNIEAGLSYAEELLDNDSISDKATKNILLLSDGLPNIGKNIRDGKYEYKDYYYYSYANAAYNKSEIIKNKDIYLYTLGFFHSLRNSELDFARRFMKDLQSAGYYDVVNPEDLEFVFDDIATDITKVTGVFRYPGHDGRDYDATYYYDDSYFSSNAYNPSLATMSLCFTMSAFASNEVNDYSLKSNNAKNLLTQIGFSDFEVSSGYKVKPTTDSIGAVAAKKKLTDVNGEDYTLIAVATRGAGYESEWAGNFTIGVDGDHEGFTKAKDQVIQFIKEYINNNNIVGKVKLWITGFSRGAATANLVAGEIINGEKLSDNITLNNNDLYAYCFETPQGTVNKIANDLGKYYQIYNIINLSDPVPMVAPTPWDFKRYGEDRFLPSSRTTSTYSSELEKMLIQYEQLESTGAYIVDDFAMKKISINIDGIKIENDINNKVTQGAFLDRVIEVISLEIIESREKYVDKLQNGVREIFSVLNGTNDKQWKQFKDEFNRSIVKVETLVPIVSAAIKRTPISLASAVNAIEKSLVESLNKANITDYTQGDINKLAITILDCVIDFGVSYPNHFVTIISNLSMLGEAHYPELCFAWLQSMDKNYTTNASETFASAVYRIVRINCPIDVEVYDNNNNLVANIINDEPKEIYGSSIISAINEDGEKIIYLPANQEYRLKMIATDSGTMSYSINEFSYEVGYINRIVNYYDVSISKGDELISTLPKYSNIDLENSAINGSSTKYEFLDSNGKVIDNNSDILGVDAIKASYKVEIINKNEELGVVLGQGTRVEGGYALVTAIPMEDCEFEGWFVDDKMISDELEFRFRVEKNITLVAKFSENIKDTDNKVVSVNSVSLDKDSISMKIGENETLKATINPEDATVKDLKWSSNNTKIVSVNENGVIEALSEGVAIITVTTVDGNKTDSCKVTVKSNDEMVNTLPKIIAKDIEIEIGDKYDSLKGVKATDKEDGDITDKIKVIENTVDTTKAGKYKVVYEVTDSKGQTVKKEIVVTVKGKDVVVNTAPEITAKDVVIEIGDKYDPLKGVKATDKEDGDITDKIKVIENSVDTTKAGKYKVIYEVTDSEGQTVRKEVVVMVEVNRIEVNGNNTGKGDLPQTGGNNSLVGIVIGIMCLASGVWVVFRKKVVKSQNKNN